MIQTKDSHMEAHLTQRFCLEGQGERKPGMAGVFCLWVFWMFLSPVDGWMQDTTPYYLTVESSDAVGDGGTVYRF